MSRPARQQGSTGEARAAAPAKLNLYLHVLGRRADGYHLLDSLVAFAALGDTVSVRPAGRLTVSVSGPFGAALADEPDNLVLRAARRLAEAKAVRAGAAIELVKRLPVSAGLGGGSSDAAAALRAFDRLWGLGMEGVELNQLARDLGADVPVCIAGRASFVGGIGAAVEPAPALPQAALVLANPGVPLATKEVYAAHRSAGSEPARFREAPRDTAHLAALLAARRNDLTEPAQALVPAIGTVLEALAGKPGCLLARMSGSGPTCFGLFADAAAAERAAKALAANHPDWWLKPTALIGDVRELAEGA